MIGAHDLPVAACGLIGLLGTLLLAMARPEAHQPIPDPKAAQTAPENPIPTSLESARMLRRKSAVLAIQRASRHEA
jgi:hypothetical protein